MLRIRCDSYSALVLLELIAGMVFQTNKTIPENCLKVGFIACFLCFCMSVASLDSGLRFKFKKIQVFWLFKYLIS